MRTDIDHPSDWIGRTERVENETTVFPMRAFAATLNRNHAPVQPGERCTLRVP